MNLRPKVIIGLIQGLALLIFASCEEPGRIGIDVDPDNLTFSTSYVKFNLEAKIVQTDSILSGNGGRLLVGRFQDPEFGEVEAKTYTQLWLSNPVNFPEESVYDSLVLVLPFDYVNGAEMRDINDIKVFRIKEDLSIFNIYVSTMELDVYDEPIGESSFMYTTELVDGEEVIKLDTLFHMRLSDDLGQEIFDMAKDENDTILESNTNWINWFKGISIEAGDQYTTITGFNRNSAAAKMILYYHIFDTDGNEVVANYPFTIENSVHFNNIKYDRTGTPLEGVTELYKEYSATDNFVYIQSGTGLVSKIDFNPFIDFADSVGPMLINLGRLTLGKVEPFSAYMKPPSTLLYYYTDTTNMWLREENQIPRTIQQDNPTVDAAGVQVALIAEFKLDEEETELNDTYSNGVSNTLQAMADGRIVADKILVYATPPENATSVNRVRIDPQNITLEVYFTTVNSNNNE